MKNRILLFCLLLILIFGVVGCGQTNKEDNNDVNNEQNEIQEKSFKEKFYGTEFKCDDIKDKEVQYYDGHIMILDNYLYKIASNNNIFSNNQQCMKVDGAALSRFVLNGRYDVRLFINGKKDIYGFNGSLYVPDVPSLRPMETYLISKYDDIIDYQESNYENVDEMRTIFNFYNLRTDGNIYKTSILQKSDAPSPSQMYSIKGDSIAYSSKDYGKIKYFEYSSANLDSKEEIFILSENGLYKTEEIKTEECEKYEDIECTNELVLNKNYLKYKNEIKYINSKYFIDYDNNIYSTSNLLYFSDND